MHHVKPRQVRPYIPVFHHYILTGRKSGKQDNNVFLEATLFRRGEQLQKLALNAQLSFTLRQAGKKRRRVEQQGIDVPAVLDFELLCSDLIIYDGFEPQEGFTNQHNVVEVMVQPQVFLPAENMQLIFTVCQVHIVIFPC